MRRVLAGALLLIGGGCSGGAGADNDLDWETSQCQLSGDAQLNGMSWNGCRAHYYADGHVLTIQLMAGGTSGSFAVPGAGWLVLNENVESAQNATLQVTGATQVLPTSVPVERMGVVFVNPSGGNVAGTGSLSVGSNILNHIPGSSGGGFDVDVTFHQRHRGRATTQRRSARGRTALTPTAAIGACSPASPTARGSWVWSPPFVLSSHRLRRPPEEAGCGAHRSS